MRYFQVTEDPFTYIYHEIGGGCVSFLIRNNLFWPTAGGVRNSRDLAFCGTIEKVKFFQSGKLDVRFLRYRCLFFLIFPRGGQVEFDGIYSNREDIASKGEWWWSVLYKYSLLTGIKFYPSSR